MRLRSATFTFLSITAAAIPVACSSGHTLFAGSESTGTGGSTSPGASSSGAGASGSSGSGGSGGVAGGGGSTTGPSSSSSGSTTTSSSSSGSATTSSSSSTSSSSTSGTSAYPAAFPDPPQVVSFGGSTLAAPKIYPVFFANDDAATVASLTDFTQKIGATPYWTATTSEYGVGPATGGAAIKIATAAPATIDDSAIQQFLATQFMTNPAFPAPDANTLVILYYPAGTSITLQGAKSCQVFGGYHQDTVVKGVSIAYAVVPRCGNLDETTGDASHELVEAATDPRPTTNPAYAQVDDSDILWELFVGGGETGDLCAQFPAVFTKFSPFPYTVQRTWSNKAIKAGHDPCQPELPGEVFFNAAPVLPDMAQVNIQGQPVTVRSVKIPVGGMKTIPINLYSEGPTAPWTVSVSDLSQSFGGQLSLSLDKTTGQNGDVLQLTIQVIKAGQGNVEAFLVKSVQNGQPQHGDWFAAVSN